MIARISKQILIQFCILIFMVSSVSKEAEAGWDGTGGASISEITEWISSLTCETEGIHKFLMEPNAHTCIPMELLTLWVAGIISPGIYYNMMLRTRIQDETLFPGACSRENRADSRNPTLSFGLCSNALMVYWRTRLLAEFSGMSFYSTITGNPEDVVPQFQTLLQGFNDPREYTVVFNNKRDGDTGFFGDVSVLTAVSGFPWQVQLGADKICVKTLSLLGWIPVGCKFLTEPHPRSFLRGFVYGTLGGASSWSGSGSFGQSSTSSSSIVGGRTPADLHAFMQCSTAGGCAARVQEYSQAPLPISSTIVECLRSMISKMLISRSVCVMQSFDIATLPRTDSSLYHFQTNMRRAVMAFLTLYIMSVGFKILMGGVDNMPKPNEAILIIVKFVLVIYFSVGIDFHDGTGTLRFDGMSELIFPLLLRSTSIITTWFMGATPSGLCHFPMSSYQGGMGHLALWDTLDCKVIHYLGLDVIRTLWNNANSLDPLGGSIPPYAIVLIPALIYKQMNLVCLCIAYPLIVMSLAAFLVNAFCVCMIAIAIIGMLAPIFVPMALFEGTKGYFQSWYTMLISFVLQPIVVVAFMTLMFGVYDQSFYGNCKFKRIDIAGPNPSVTKKLFVIDTDTDSYPGGRTDLNACQQTIGYLFNQPFISLLAMTRTGTGGQKMIDMTRIGSNEKSFAENLDRFTMTNAISSTSGFFFDYIKSAGAFAWNIVINMLTNILMLYLMYKLAGNLAEFAADIAQSAVLQGTVTPTGMADKVMDAVKGKKPKKDKDDDSKGDGDSGGGGGGQGGGGGSSTPTMG